VLISVATIVAVVIIVGLRISDGFVNKSRLTAMTQTLKSTSNVLMGCRIGGVAVFPPNDIQDPQNLPCQDATKFATLGKNSTSGCVYNTVFVTSITGGGVAGGAIQAGCNCKGKTIATCSDVFQCDFATTGQCISKNIAN
jgi:hypothetical protein